jgi:hypothetical protein
MEFWHLWSRFDPEREKQLSKPAVDPRRSYETAAFHPELLQKLSLVFRRHPAFLRPKAPAASTR